MQPNHKQENGLADSYPIEDRVNALIEQLSAYIEHYHSGSVKFVALDNNVVSVKLGGACETCDLQTHTLHGWVEGTLRQFFPQIERVEAVE